MKIRDSYIRLPHDADHAEYSSGIDIIADDGYTLFSILMIDKRTIEVSAGTVCKQDNVLIDDVFQIRPISVNRIQIQRDLYKE